MFSFINLPAKILTYLELNITPKEVASGVCLGMLLGFIPMNGTMTILLFILFFILKINRFSTALTLPLFKLLYISGFWKIADQIGTYLLVDANYLNNFWRFLVNLPIIAYLEVNNTLVAGGLALSLILIVPVYFLAKFIYIRFIEKNLTKIQNSKLAKRLTKYRLVNKIVLNADKIRSKTE